MATIPTNFNLPTSKQIPDHAILDYFNKQTYLGNQFVCTFDKTSLTGTSEQTLFLLENPLTVSTVVNYKSLFVNLRKIVGLTAAHNALMRVYMGATVSTGTPKTIQNIRPASGTQAVAIASSSPTGTSGVLVELLTSLTYSQSRSDLLMIIDPGQTLLFTVQLDASSDISAQIGWFEL